MNSSDWPDTHTLLAHEQRASTHKQIHKSLAHTHNTHIPTLFTHQLALTHTHTCTHTHIQTNTPTRTHTHTHTYTHTHTLAHVFLSDFDWAERYIRAREKEDGKIFNWKDLDPFVFIPSWQIKSDENEGIAVCRKNVFLSDLKFSHLLLFFWRKKKLF